VGLALGLAGWGGMRAFGPPGVPSVRIPVREVRGVACMEPRQLLEAMGWSQGIPLGQLLRFPSERVCALDPRIEGARPAWRDGGLVLKVSERVPVALWVGPSGEPRAVSEDGSAWELEGGLPDLPVLGPVEAGTEAGEVLAWLGRLRRERPALWASVSQVVPSGAGGWEVVLEPPGHRLLLLPAAVSEIPWGAIYGILEDLDRRGLKDAVLDLRFDGQVVVRLPEEDRRG
jgi:hypothetical protein